MRGSDDDDVIVIGSSGEIQQLGDGAKAKLATAAGRHRALPIGRDMLLLRRAGEQRAHLLVAGEILSSSTMMEAVSLIAQTDWEGELEVRGSSSVRRFEIAGGALKGAASNVLSERLGEILVSGGVLDAHKLAQCVSLASPKRRIGEIAIDSGFLSREQLFDALHDQVRLIFQNALLEERGHYAMLRHAKVEDPRDSGPMLLVHLPIQALLMESVQRIDEMAMFRERIPNSDCCPVMTARASRISIAESLRPVMALADGDHSILEIARALRSDEYQTTRRVAQLLQIGAVEIRAERKLDEVAVARMIAQFNHVLRRIFDTVGRFGSTSEIHWTLQAWVRDTALRQFFDGALLPEGTIDIEQTLALMSRLELERPLETLHEALQELAGFAMLSAGSSLPRDAERSLSRLVHQKLSMLRHGAH